jgi:adenylosuccinate synthase
MDDISSAREVGDLPKEARAYLETMEQLTGTPISWASVGPARDQIVRMSDVA